jgi:lipopolysaccharide export LptBFGC system permease protein LptF
MIDTENGKTGEGLSPTGQQKTPPPVDFSPDILAEYEKCITCKDYGKNCKGPKLAALKTIGNVREYHRRLREYRKITMKQLYMLTEHDISSAAVKEYFSHEEKGFRWTTVSVIDNAITSFCGECIGLPPAYLPNCPATSSEIREQIDSVAVKLMAAESECLALQARVADNKKSHIEQLNAFREDQQARVDWLKADIKLWRKIAFSLLGALVLVLILLVAYIAIDFANPGAGFFRK